MSKVVLLLGVLQVIAGLFVLAVAPTSIHQILGAIVFGFGVVSMGVSETARLVGRQLSVFETMEKLCAKNTDIAPAPDDVAYRLPGWRPARRQEPTL